MFLFNMWINSQKPLSNIFRILVHVGPNRKFNKQIVILAKKNQHTQSRINPSDKIFKQSYQNASFFRYFEHFMKENQFLKYVSSESLFEYRKIVNEFEEVSQLVSDDFKNEDENFITLAKSEIVQLSEKLILLQDQMLSDSIIDDQNIDECKFEVRAGVGGKEASVFASELFLFYLKFFPFNGWSLKKEKEEFEQIDICENTDLFTEVIEVTGHECYKFLRHEAGVHRVQRVPKTEKYGRLHTSTVSISVVPVYKNLVDVKESDLKFEMKNSSGPGGQNVNRNLTCVRVTHLPTGNVVECQDTRYQYLNKTTAIKKMKELLNRLEFERVEKEIRHQKRVQIGIAARSDKIRTYNYPQNRITDHRIPQNLYNVESFMEGQQCDKLKQLIVNLEALRHSELVKQLRLAFEQKFIDINKSN